VAHETLPGEPGDGGQRQRPGIGVEPGLDPDPDHRRLVEVHAEDRPLQREQLTARRRC